VSVSFGWVVTLGMPASKGVVELFYRMGGGRG